MIHLGYLLIGVLIGLAIVLACALVWVRLRKNLERLIRHVVCDSFAVKILEDRVNKIERNTPKEVTPYCEHKLLWSRVEQIDAQLFDLMLRHPDTHGDGLKKTEVHDPAALIKELKRESADALLRFQQAQMKACVKDRNGGKRTTQKRR